MILKNKASRTAYDIIKKYGITEPNEFSIQTIAELEGAIVQEKSIKGAQGRILFGKEGRKSIITINKNITNTQKKSFVLAHELGHLVLHRNLEHFFSCNDGDFLDWHRKGSHESEANQFAAELLMPAELFSEKAIVEKFSFEHLRNLAKLFNTSITATAIRYAQYGNIPIGIVYSQNNFIRWFSSSDKFIYPFFKIKEAVPSGTVASRYFKSGTIVKEPKVILPLWFSDYNTKSDVYFYEHCFPFKKLNSTLSFIWLCEDYQV